MGEQYGQRNVTAREVGFYLGILRDLGWLTVSGFSAWTEVGDRSRKPKQGTEAGNRSREPKQGTEAGSRSRELNQGPDAGTRTGD